MSPSNNLTKYWEHLQILEEGEEEERHRICTRPDQKICLNKIVNIIELYTCNVIA